MCFRHMKSGLVGLWPSEQARAISSKAPPDPSLASRLRADRRHFEGSCGSRQARTTIVNLFEVWRQRNRQTSQKFDLSVNNVLALHNSQLVLQYTKIHPAFHQLIYTIKHWAKRRGVASPSDGSLSPYAWSLLAINYLQCKHRCPSLQHPPNGERQTQMIHCKRTNQPVNAWYTNNLPAATAHTGAISPPSLLMLGSFSSTSRVQRRRA